MYIYIYMYIYIKPRCDSTVIIKPILKKMRPEMVIEIQNRFLHG